MSLTIQTTDGVVHASGEVQLNTYVQSYPTEWRAVRLGFLFGAGFTAGAFIVCCVILAISAIIAELH